MQSAVLAKIQQELVRLMCLIEHNLLRLLRFGLKPLPGEAQTAHPSSLLWVVEATEERSWLGVAGGRMCWERDLPQRKAPAVALGEDAGNMLKEDGKKETETSYKPHSFNVGHSNTAFGL